MKKIFSFIFGMMVAAPAFAYVVGTAGSNTMDPNQRTHIIIVGRGDELGRALQVSAVTKAKKYQDMYPNEQIYLISVNESDANGADIAFLEKHGIRNLSQPSSGFNSQDVLREMGKFNRIASVDIFSHSVAYYGVILDGKTNRMDPKKDGYGVLKGKFTEDAFALLHGCNSGQILARVFSLQWGIPVAGSFTGTTFQYLHEDGKFYHGDARKPVNIPVATVNKVTFERNIGCYQGACARMNPDNGAYNGYWGSFNEGGLGFYKFFCVENSQEQCFRTMAKAAMSFVSVKALRSNSSLEDYKAVVQDFLCPATGKRAECMAQLERSLTTNEAYDPFSAKSLQCDFKTCKAQFTCKRVAFVDLLKPGSCSVANLRTSNKTSTLVNEYKAYIAGWKLLQQR